MQKVKEVRGGQNIRSSLWLNTSWLTGWGSGNYSLLMLPELLGSELTNQDSPLTLNRPTKQIGHSRRHNRFSHCGHNDNRNKEIPYPTRKSILRTLT